MYCIVGYFEGENFMNHQEYLVINVFFLILRHKWQLIRETCKNYPLKNPAIRYCSGPVETLNNHYIPLGLDG